MRLNMPSPAPHLCSLPRGACLESRSSGRHLLRFSEALTQQGLSGATGAGPEAQVWRVKGWGPVAASSYGRQCLADCEWLCGRVTVRLAVRACVCEWRRVYL